MRVTRFQYPMEENLIQKIDLMIERCTDTRAKKDVVLICEGAEGEGKTTLSVAIAYYFSEKTGRSFNAENIFFDLEQLIKFAQSENNQIIIWDEPALQALSSDWSSTVVKNLTRLLMMARNKRHFIIINMTKFYKFNEYVSVDRPIAMIHVYSRKNIYSGRFIFIRKKFLEPLWRDYRFGKKRNYKKYASKKIRGSFPDILSPDYKYNVLKEFNLKLYERHKDKAISSIGFIQKKVIVDKETELKYKMATIPGKTVKELAKIYNVTERQVVYWREKGKSSLKQSAKPTPNNTIGIAEDDFIKKEEET